MEVDEMSNDMKRKAASSLEESSDEDEEHEVPIENAGIVRDVLHTNQELGAVNAELTRKLQAKDSTIQLLASQAGVPSSQVSDWLYAQSVNQDQLHAQSDAQAGVSMETRPSTSHEHVEGVLKKKGKDTSKGKEKVSPDKSAEKPTEKPAEKPAEKESTKDSSAVKKTPKNNLKSPKGDKKGDPKTSSKTKKLRLDDLSKEQSTKKLYNAYLKSKKKERSSKSQNAGGSSKGKSAKDKGTEEDSDTDHDDQSHGAGGDEDNKSSTDSWEELGSESGSQKEPRSALKRINQNAEDAIEAERLSRKEAKRLCKDQRRQKMH